MFGYSPGMTETNEDFIHAPWTDEQVAALNTYQVSGVFHPFTCGKRDEPGHEHPVDDGLLVATNDGWVCSNPSCDYTQEWAWRAMANTEMLFSWKRIIGRTCEVD